MRHALGVLSIVLIVAIVVCAFAGHTRLCAGLSAVALAVVFLRIVHQVDSPPPPVPEWCRRRD